MQVSEILRIKGSLLITTNPSTKVSDCVIAMAEQDVGSMVVMEAGKLVGMLTFREVIQVLAKRQQENRTGPTPPVAEILVGAVMQKNPLTVTPKTDINEVRKQMIEQHARYVPVVDEGVLMGVMSFYDVARAVLDAQNFENKMLKAYIADWPVEKDE